MGLAALALTIAAWFVPMIYASGGVKAYFGALLSLWAMVPSKETVFNSSPATSIARAFTIAFIYLLGFGAASLAPLGALVRKAASRFSQKDLHCRMGRSSALFLHFWLSQICQQWLPVAPCRARMHVARRMGVGMVCCQRMAKVLKTGRHRRVRSSKCSYLPGIAVLLLLQTSTTI